MATAETEADGLPGRVISPETDELPEVRIVDLEDLVDDDGNPVFADPDNANEHDDGELARLASSFSEHGVLETVVLNRATRELIGGHGRIQAAYRAHKKQMILLVTEKDWIGQRTANLALNSGGYGHMNDEVLAAQLRELTQHIDPSLQSLEGIEGLVGFRPGRLEELLPELSSTGPGGAAIPPTDFPGYDTDIPTEHTCPKCGYRFSGGK